jgi:hypothetical protein
VLLGGSTLADLGRMYGEGPLAAYPPQTPTTLAALKDMIDADAQRGYGVSQGGFESGSPGTVGDQPGRHRRGARGTLRRLSRRTGPILVRQPLPTVGSQVSPADPANRIAVTTHAV